jgi:hypothetical protein
MRIPTPWQPNSSKPTTAWGETAKNPSPWSESNPKNPTAFTPSDTRTPAGWNPNFQAPQTYLYNDENMTYNSTLVNYNNLINNNQINQRLVTTWRDA